MFIINIRSYGKTKVVTCEFVLGSLMIYNIPSIILFFCTVFNPLTINKQLVVAMAVKSCVRILARFPACVGSDKCEPDRLLTTWLTSKNKSESN